MAPEFERYGLAKLRRLTGALEVAGALGMVAGYMIQPLSAISAGCLSLLMLFAMGFRVRVRDSFVQILPALSLGVMNAYIVIYGVQGFAT